MTTQVQVPFNIEAEESVLGSVLIDPSCLDSVAAIVAPSDFYIVKNGWVFEALLSIVRQKQAIDYVTVCNELMVRKRLDEIGGAAYISRLVNVVPTAMNAISYAKIVRADSLRRIKIEQATRIVQMAYDRSVSTDILSAESIRLMLTGERLDGRTARAYDVADELLTQVSDWATNPLAPGKVRGLSVGLRGLDAVLGGLDSDTLAIIAGRPSMGKSALVFQIAENVAIQGHSVAAFSLEMNRKKFLARLACGRAAVNWLRIRQGTAGDDDLARMVRELGLLSDLPMVINDSTNLTIAQIRATVAALHAQNPLSLVVLDHIGLVCDPEQNQVLKLHNVSWGLKQIAKDFHIPVIAVCQLSRAVETRVDKRPMLADLRESGRIEENADVVIMLYRDKYYEPELETDVAEAWIRKNRDGESPARAKMYFRAEYTRFGDLAHGFS